jgi:hypothetical protein
MLVLWQEDLAGRLASLKAADAKDDPTLKARMRDLEDEQRQIREALAQLLDDIQESCEKLPETEELKELRETSQKFVKDVRASGASEAMVEAEKGLGDFSGKRGYENAQKAADILKKFLNNCKGGMGAAGSRCLTFSPKLCRSMGDTLGQLMAGMGAGGGRGFGMGGGSMGLFGGLPIGAGQDGKNGSTRAGSGRGFAHSNANPGENNPDAGDPGAANVPGNAAGATEGGIPARYQRPVGQYFDRIREETGETDF